MDFKKELEIALTCYITEKHTQEECSGFIAGFEALQEVVNKNDLSSDVVVSEAEVCEHDYEHISQGVHKPVYCSNCGEEL